MRTFVTFVSLTLICSLSATGASVDFSQDILPVLAAKCFPCHGPDAEKRQADLRLDDGKSLYDELPSGVTAVVPGRKDLSALINRITAEDAAERMPPEDFSKTLTAEEIRAFAQWVEEGAAWERHWSLEPITSPSPPSVNDREWPRNDIDAFILSKLESLGMTPSPEADRRTLIRRLTFDLHGLPPTPAEVEDFLNNSDPKAYENLVDRLLASPRYGERWGRHWLDVAHYADTHGYDKDKRRKNAWPYRDYVINSFNNDKPYGRFIEEQLAGDVLYPNDPQALVATGFIAAGPWDFVGHVELREGTVDKNITRNLDRDDMVTSTMTTFTSLTVQCARCHDHKFDPISQGDYYGLQAVFAGIDRADRSYDADPEVHRTRKLLSDRQRPLQERMNNWNARLKDLTSPQLKDIDERISTLRKEIKELRPSESPSNGYHSLISSEAETTKWVQVDLGSSKVVETIRLVSALPTDFAHTPGFGFPVRFKVEISNDSEFSSSTMVLDQTNADHPVRTDKPFRLNVDKVEGQFVRVTATKLWKRTGDFVFALAEMEVYSEGENVALKAAVTARDSTDAGRWHTQYLTDGYNSRRRIGSNLESGDFADLLELKESELKLLSLEREETKRDLLSASERKELFTLESDLKQINEQLAELPKAMKVYAAAADFAAQGNFSPSKVIRNVRILHRGEISRPGNHAVPGAVERVSHLPSQFDLPDEHDEGERRAALARWISDTTNPLTWRSIVNRVWHYHFGQGIVGTPNDFGRMGTPPTHPELLDWLATEFLAHDQSLKVLHRLIVTSATYRQQSLDNEEYARLDSSNRFLWRMNRRQLDAEALRDSVLYVSGKLDLTMGGPGFDAFVFEDDHSPRYFYAQLDPNNTSAFRRSVYRFVVRSVPDPFMMSLDCADPSQSVPVRNETITALQALALLNNPMVVRHAAFLAERIEARADNLSSQLIDLYELTVNRLPTLIEINALRPYANEHGLAAACRLVLNSNEFIFVD